MKFNNIEAQDGSKRSHIASGIGATCTVALTGTSNNFIRISCTAGSITHYYIAQNGVAAIHMATYASAPLPVGELRYIARLRRSTITNGFPAATTDGGSAIEGSDVFLVNGQTRSKFYSSRQFIDDAVKGVSGPGIAIHMVVDPPRGFEGSSGGPFFRDIDNQIGDVNELYFYMHSGHTQTENFRTGLKGPYSLIFTTGSVPAVPNYGFYDSLGLTGWLAQSGRGRVTGKATGTNVPQYVVVAWSNANAQYWTRAATDGSFTSPYMKPGTYTMTLYKIELAVATASVTVSGGGTTTSNIVSTEPARSAIFQLGDYDGTPRGFINADKIEWQHPSDSRMTTPWARSVAVSSGAGAVPMAIFKDLGSLTLTFSLSSSQIGARVFEIATTLAFAGGRPVITVNNSWTSSIPAAPSQPDSRGVTRGTWRGNNILYTYNIPSGVLVSGSNTVSIGVASGSSGAQFLSPNVVLDMLRLY
ncbi:polysaccharide lyase family 4 protein [Pterulicium gracile]|uniref:rhamnogalacturonan endolyase n=1 Tax=Pterulicium gracile TaxID=1884261 RepID=A0A5C3QJJ5_9AGAR|nr:polysaccharide lyase family 4 protein [Pterula gracilis]